MSSFRVLVVCTANACRSPMMEALLRARIDTLGLPWQVSSAGTRAQTGQDLYPQTAKLLATRGHPPTGWTTHRLTARMVAASDLIITAEAVHRSVAVQLYPPAISHIYPLLQLARIADEMPLVGGQPAAVRGPVWLDQLSEARTLVQPVAFGADDLADPIGHRDRAFRKCADTIDAALTRIFRPLGG